MDNQPNSLISRIPPEIWWHIFDYVIVLEYLLDEVYEGDDWISYAAEVARAGPLTTMCLAEKQRQIIGLVCKSWNQIATLIKHRFVHLSSDYADELTPEVIKKAWYVYVWDLDLTFIIGLTGCEVEWRVLRIPYEYVKRMAGVRHPNLRKLEIVRRSEVFEAPQVDELIESLKQSTGITWFGFHTATSLSTLPCRPDKGQCITLKNLQSIHCISSGDLQFPYYRLDLPCLRHLYLSARPCQSDVFFPLHQLIEAYGQTLYSFYLEFPLKRPLITPSDPTFPDWAIAPHLQELAIDAPVHLKFHPLPSKHPLRVFAARIWRMDNLASWLESENLKEVRILHAHRNSDGSLSPRYPYMVYWNIHSIGDISAAKMNILWETAELKGIKLRTCMQADGVDRN
ncbi:hypothetical protein FRC20_009092 [Serendipita sp. 405]|nr:hypothetical protein FRC20_009092 [Serendipita sp. 405]